MNYSLALLTVGLRTTAVPAVPAVPCDALLCKSTGVNCGNLVHYEDKRKVTETETVACEAAFNPHLRDVNTFHSEVPQYTDGLFVSQGPVLSYRYAAAGVEEEVGSVGSHRRQVGNRPVAQCHANNGSHVGFCAKDMNWDTSGLSCGERPRVKLTVVHNICQAVTEKHSFIIV